MNSRERLLAGISHRKTDRLPVDLGATPSSGISAIAYNNLKKYLGIKDGHTRVYDVVQQLAQPEEWALGLFGVDVLDIGRAFNTENADWHTFTLSDGSTAEYPSWFHPVCRADCGQDAYSRDGALVGRMPEGATFFDQTVFPYIDGYPANYHDLPRAMNSVVWSALAHSPWDHMGEIGFWNDLREKTFLLRRTTDRALMMVCGCNLFEWGMFLRRSDQFLMDIYSEQKEVERLLDALMEIHLALLNRVCQAVGDCADIIRFGDDLGMTSGSFMSPQVYRKLFKPRHRMLCEYVKKHSGMKIMLHTCGSVFELIPDLIDAGYDILNPVQTNARNMEPERLKRQFGADVTFWGGGSDTKEVLNRGTPRQVRADTRRRLEVFAPEGGYVFSSTHNILPDVPPQNIVAMFETVKEYSGKK